MRVSDAVIDRLREAGIGTVFGIPGKQTLPLNERIEGADDLRFVVARHETAVSQAAWGYAESGGGMAATLVVPGPGDMNAMNGLKNALNDCVPLLHLSVETDPEVRGGDGIHETPPDTYDNVVKHNVTVETPESAAAEVARAIAVARTPPTGPVRVGIPKRFLTEDVAVAGTGAYRPEEPRGVPDGDLEAAVDLLAGAASPVILAGGGVRRAGAADELRAVAERLDAPVATTRKGKGAIPEDHPLAAGAVDVPTPERRSLFEEADAALGVGTDFDAVTTGGWSLPVPDRLVHVTMHPGDVGRAYDPAVGIVGDARAALGALARQLPDRDGHGADRARAVREAADDRLAEVRSVSEPPLTSASVIAAVRDALPRDSVVTGDAGGLRMWMIASFEAYGPRSYVNPGSWASMGTALPAAVGAAAADPDRPAVALVGDGGLMMAVHELHTAVAADLPVVTVVCNNADYAVISAAASRDYRLDEGAYGWSDDPIDFAALAESVGMDGVRAETPEGIREALSAAVGRDAPTLIEVPTDPLEPQARPFMDG